LTMMTSANFSAEGIIRLSDKEFRMISELVYNRFGINLTDKKKALVRGRLNSLVKSQGFTNFKSYYQSVIEDPTEDSLLSLIDRISTNHSFFFREAEHFDVLTGRVLPKLCRVLEEQSTAGQPASLRIWCAGSAAGEEPYTLAMVLAEYFGLKIERWDIGLLATDISVSALRQAVDGSYPEQRVAGVPASYRKYFSKTGPDRYDVKDKIKRMVLYKRLNLMREQYPFKGKFHVIFCRNVMIYFDPETKNKLVGRFHRYLHENGYLFIGHSETLGKDPGIYRYVQPTVYQKV